MRYGMNKFVRNGEVKFGEWDGIKLTMCYGTKLYDGRCLIGGSHISRTLLGQPHEMVLRIGGVTYYPTRAGYVRLD